MSFKNKVVLITGASSGIGAVTAIQFAEEGAKLAIVGRNEMKLEVVSQKCEKAGSKPLVIIADVTEDEDIHRIVDDTITYFSKLDILINNVGIVSTGSIFSDNVMNVFDRIMNTNLRSAIFLTHLAAKHLIKSRGCIINIGSVSGKGDLLPGNFSYGVAKAGLEHFTKSAALEFGKKGVRVNIVVPGPTKTDFMDGMGLNQEEKDKLWSILREGTVLDKVSEASEIADVIMFLASDKAKSVTGSSYVVDNGMLLKGLLKSLDM